MYTVDYWRAKESFPEKKGTELSHEGKTGAARGRDKQIVAKGQTEGAFPVI